MAKKTIWFPFTENGSLLAYTEHYAPNDAWGRREDGSYGPLPVDENASEIVCPYNGRRYVGEVDGVRQYEDYVTQTLTWRRAFETMMTLTYARYERGRSAAHTYWTRDDGATFPVFLTCLDDLFKHSVIVKGTVTNNWTFIKRGSNYSLCVVGYEQRQAEEKRAAKAASDARWAEIEKRGAF